MGSPSSYFHLLLAGMRLVGAFPFAEKRRAKPHKEAKDNHLSPPEDGKQSPTPVSFTSMEDHVVFQKSPFWTCWATLVGVAAISFFALGWWNLTQDQDHSIGFPQHMESTYYAYKINEIMDVMTMAALMLYVFCRRALLRQVIEVFYKIFRGRANDPAIANFPFSMVIPLTFNLACALIIIVTVVKKEVFMSTKVITAIMQELAFYLMSSNILIMLQVIIFLITNEYNCIIASLHTCLGDASHYPDLRHQYEYQVITSKVLNVFKTKAVYNSSVWADLIHSVNKPARLSDIDYRLLDAKERLTQAHELGRLANMYCGVPVTLLLLFSVVTCILSLFFMSFITELATYDIILTLALTLNSLVTTIYFCNAPNIVREKLQDLKFVLRTLLYNPGNKRIRTKLRHLLALLQVAPPPAMLGLFILGRSNITSVLAFISTYVVILLQFRFTETSTGAITNTTHATNTTA